MEKKLHFHTLTIKKLNFPRFHLFYTFQRPDSPIVLRDRTAHKHPTGLLSISGPLLTAPTSFPNIFHTICTYLTSLPFGLP